MVNSSLIKSTRYYLARENKEKKKIKIWAVVKVGFLFVNQHSL